MKEELTRNIYKVGYALQKASPTILIVGGAIGVVASTVMACKATLKVNEVLEEPKQTIERINEAKEAGATKAGVSYSLEDAKKDTVMVYTKTAVNLAKLYGPSVLLGAVSLGSMLYSHKIMSKRNIGLAAAFTATDQAFKQYRKNVVNKFGEAVDAELRTGLKVEEKEVVEQDENGNSVTTKKKDVSYDKRLGNLGNDGIFFDESSRFFQKNRELNLLFVRSVEQALNRKLKRKGRVMLNEALDMLGYDYREDGQYIGWVYDPEHPIGDNKIYFNIPYKNVEKIFDEAGYTYSVSEPVFWLSFNHDGTIIDKGW